eukprot:gene35523-46053_t
MSSSGKMIVGEFFQELFSTYGQACNETHSRGASYDQLYRLYPALSPYYSEFEKSYDPTPVLQFMKDMNYSVPFASVLLYLLFCYFGGKIMEKQKAFYGAVRTVPHMLHRIFYLPFEQTVCEPPHTAYGAGACGLAVQ